MAAQLTWKRALEDSSPVMVNGSAGPTAELLQVDPFQPDLFQDDQPRELVEEEPAAALQNEHSDEKEEEEEKEDDSSNLEERPKPDALDDLYSHLSSSNMYNSLSALTKPRENAVRVMFSTWLLYFQ